MQRIRRIWQGDRVGYIVSIFVFIIALYTYVRTLAPGVLGGDAGELQFVPYILGLTHPTGYPLYCLVGKLWSYLPIGTVAYRMNLLAAIFAALTVSGLYLLVLKLTRARIPALLGALTLAFSPVFWSQAVIGDKYALNALFVVAISGLAFLLADDPKPLRFYLLAFFFGLSHTHHRTMIVLTPALFLLIFLVGRKSLLRLSTIAKALIFFILPLALYIYIPIAAAKSLPPGTWSIDGLADFVAYILDIGYVKQIEVMGNVECIVYYLRTLLQNFIPWGIALGLIGLIVSFVRSRRYGIFLIAGFLLEGYLGLSYNVPRRWVFFLPSFTLFALWIALGMAFLLELPRRVLRGKLWIDLSMIIAVLALVIVPASLFREHHPHFREMHLDGGTLGIWRQELKHGHAGQRLGSSLSLVRPEAIIVCDWEQATVFWYMQQVEGLRKDVLIKYPIGRLDELAEKAARESRPLYLARTLPGIAQRWHPVSIGPLIWLRDEPNYDTPSDIRIVEANFGGRLELMGFGYGEASLRAGSVIPITLYWRALRPLQADYSISMRLFDEAGQEVLKFDSQHPVLGTYPSSRWHKDEVVSDYYEIPLDRSLPQGCYHWGVIVYRTLAEGSWENLQVVGREPPTDFAICDEFELK